MERMAETPGSGQQNLERGDSGDRAAYVASFAF